MDELSLDRYKDQGQFCKFTPLFSDSLSQTDWELHQEDNMSGLDMDWMPPPIPSSPDPESPLLVFQLTGNVLLGPPERDKLVDPIVEDVLEPRLPPEGGMCVDNDCILQENTHFGEETTGWANDLTVPLRDDAFRPPEGDESISWDSHFYNNREPPSKSFQLNLEDNMLNDEKKLS